MDGQIGKIERHILLVASHARAGDLADQLRGRGYFVREAEMAEAAGHEAHTDWTRLILLDAQFNNACALARKFASDPQTQHIPIVFVAFQDKVLDRSQVFQSGGSDYLFPPFLPDEIDARLEGQIARSLIKQIAQHQQEPAQPRDLIREAELFRRFVPQTLITELYQQDFNLY